MKKLIGLIFALTILILPGYNVKAADPVIYMVWDDTNNMLKEADSPCSDYTVVTDQTLWGSSNTETWYVVKNQSEDRITIPNRITVNGTVNLILCSGSSLYADKGITVSVGNTLNIYEQSEDVGNMGKLLVKSTPDNYAGIGGTSDSPDAGTINIYGGFIITEGAGGGAGIGGGSTGTEGNGNGGNGGRVCIYGGDVYSTGGPATGLLAGGAGIGGAGEIYKRGGDGGEVIIYGGVVTASGSLNSAGIGGGYGRAKAAGSNSYNIHNSGNGANVTIKGGSVGTKGWVDDYKEVTYGIGAGLGNTMHNKLEIGSGLELYGGDYSSGLRNLLSGSVNNYTGQRDFYMDIMVAPLPSPTPRPTPIPSPTPTLWPVPTVTPTPIPVIPTPTPTIGPSYIDPTADPLKGKTPSRESEVNTVRNSDGSITVLTTTENTDGSKTVKEETSGTDGQKIKIIVTEKDGTIRSQETIVSVGGIRTEIGRIQQKNEDFAQKTIVTVPSGNKAEVSESKTTYEGTGAITERKDTKEFDGSTTSYINITKQNGDFRRISEKKDPTGKIIEKTETSKATNADKTVTYKETITSSDGSVSDNTSTLNTGGVGTVSISNTSASGDVESQNYSVVGQNAALIIFVTDSRSFMMPGEIVGFNGKTWKVSVIREGAFRGLSLDSVTLSKNIEKIEKAVFEGTGIKELHIQGKVGKKLFDKNSLKGTGTGKKGKGLKIYVQSRKDKKLMNKQLKKADVPKAKVVMR